MPPDRKQATSFRAHVKLAGLTRPALLHSDERPSMHITFHDLRAGGTTYCAVRKDPPVQIQRRVGHERFETTLEYIRIAETLDPAAFGIPFPPLPGSLLKTHSEFWGGHAACSERGDATHVVLAGSPRLRLLGFVENERC